MFYLYVFIQPSHGDKVANPEVLRWVNELAKLRKDLKGKTKLLKPTSSFFIIRESTRNSVNVISLLLSLSLIRTQADEV